MKKYYVYILSNKRGTLYTGVTSDLEHRVYQHKNKLIEGFTKRYNVTRLVYFESTNDVTVAIAREKQIKGLLRSKKIDLIRAMNPEWEDLSETWFETESKKFTPTPDSSSPDVSKGNRGTPE
jgi:putative endonuclease